ncbi:MAG TPA: hypothetical protein PKD49_11460 [Hyphomicrobium sp.]|nr:hypothetical protein [Hyphomicrobium sp.]
MVEARVWLPGCFALLVLGAGLPGIAPVELRAESTAWLSDADIERSLKGHTLDGMYASGRRFTESYLETGSLAYAEDGMTLSGHWSVRAGMLCTIYDADPTGGCFRVAVMGANCFEFYFVSRSEEALPGPPGTKPGWTARGAVEGKAQACIDGASV